MGIRDNNIRKRLLQVSKLTLKDAFDIIQKYVSAAESDAQEAEVHKVDKAEPGFERSLKRVGSEISILYNSSRSCLNSFFK